MTVELGGRRWHIAQRGYDLSIPLQFSGTQPRFFGAAPASGSALTAGSFTGDVRTGASCNCESYTITPHCNGTHTECVGHITEERVSVRDCATEHLVPALLLSVTAVTAAQANESSDPQPRPGDRLITRAALQSAAGDRPLQEYRALVIRTLPNDRDKMQRDYDSGESAAYFSAEAMGWIVTAGIEHLVVDLPSLDRGDDGGRLTAHRLFWGMPPGGRSLRSATRARATVTELAFVDDEVPDGPYMLNLQIAPFMADAAPSRPVLLPLIPA